MRVFVVKKPLACHMEYFKIIYKHDSPVPVDGSGHFTDSDTDFKRMLVTAKEIDSKFKQQSQAIRRLIEDDKQKYYSHLLYFWMSDTPLIYNSVNCCFAKVTEKDHLVEYNK